MRNKVERNNPREYVTFHIVPFISFRSAQPPLHSFLSLLFYFITLPHISIAVTLPKTINEYLYVMPIDHIFSIVVQVDQWDMKPPMNLFRHQTKYNQTYERATTSTPPNTPTNTTTLFSKSDEQSISGQFPLTHKGVAVTGFEPMWEIHPYNFQDHMLLTSCIPTNTCIT